MVDQKAVTECQSNSTTVAMQRSGNGNCCQLNGCHYPKKAGDWGMKCRVQPPPKPPTQEMEWPLPCKKSSSCHFIGRTSITFLSLVAKKFGKFTFQPSNPCNIKEMLEILDMNSGCQ